MKYSKLLASMQVATALDYLHRHPLAICNRDVKLENILVFSYDAQHCDGKARPCVKLADFGFCKAHSSTAFNTQERTRLGTSYYVAPEVFGLIPCALHSTVAKCTYELNHCAI